MVSSKLRSRIQNVIQVSLKEPLAVVTSLSLLPILHLLRRSKRREGERLLRASIGSKALRSPTSSVERASDLAAAVHIAVKVWRISETSCVARSYLLWWLCARRGIASEVAVGMNPVDHKAHAWVEVAGVPVNDTRDVNERFARFDAPLAATAEGVPS